ncbi:MAG TPA: efflux RND transporter periplasmic adaptor subunit [Beijerinckiaceae bacterium]|nr:efflux RND transporter periplasmic adaptor subunit [Beijerinckiaceae bacterium]
MMTRRWGWLLAALLAGHLGNGIGMAAAKDATASQTAAPAGPRVTVSLAKRGPLVETLALTGTLVAREEVLVAPEIDGLQILQILAEEGDRVAAGQVLVRLRRDTLEALLLQNGALLAKAEAAISQARSQIVQAEAAQTQAEQALQRVTQLRQSGFSTQAQFDQLTNDAKAALARLAAAREGLELGEADQAAIQAQRKELSIRLAATEVKAPVAGVIARRSARLGATAGMAAEPLFRIVSGGEIELEGEVSDTRIHTVQPGAPAQVTALGRVVSGTVRLVSGEIDRASRLGKVRIALGADSGLKVGAFGRGVVETRRVEVITVPLPALLYSEGGTVIQVVRDKRIVTRPVRTGGSAQGRVEIVEGLAEGETFVAKAGAFLRDGDAVTPVSEAEK